MQTISTARRCGSGPRTYRRPSGRRGATQTPNASLPSLEDSTTTQVRLAIQTLEEHTGAPADTDATTKPVSPLPSTPSIITLRIHVPSSGGLLAGLVGFQNPKHREYCVPTARCRRRPKEPVDLAEIANCFHVAAVHPIHETILRANDSHQPLPTFGKSNRKRNS